ncbi:YozE family protein [Clostridium sp. ZS1]|uniref:YozE family protein n=1 Tax=Clostridium sp. ZS1 TaxID=2949989 RepID=UPI00207AF4C9|nr:YozE family protein [Clostridium sp. ZS1]
MNRIILVDEKTTFRQWIVRSYLDNNPRGDLARDVLKDVNFPNTHDYSEMVDYLRYKKACKEAMDVFRNSYRTFAKLKGLD